VPVGPMEIRNLPAGLRFEANRMVHRNDLLYFASLATSSVIVTDTNGEFRSHIGFLPLLEADQAKKDGKTIEQAVADLKLPEKYKDYKLGGARGGVTAIYNELK